MPEVMSVICDGCGVTKGETNHWWRIWTGDGGMWIYSFKEPVIASVENWTLRYYCGAACVHKALDAFMGAK